MNSRYEEVNIDDIELDLENPRIKQFLDIYGTDNKLTSEQIALALQNPGNGDAQTSYTTLKESIKVQEGVIHPIIINRTSSGKLIVIEGNTRLQIYKEFKEADPSGPWGKIRAIIYDDLTSSEIHGIRLQSHLVGPRDWPLYAKAKYLNQLSNIDHLPMERIISMCGGNKNEIRSLIAAYSDFEGHYAKLFEPGEVPTNDFSKFKELQNKSVKTAILLAKYSVSDFGRWVKDGHVDTALGVRNIPAILKSPEAKEEFLKTNISNAMKKLAVVESSNAVDISKYPYDELADALTRKLEDLPFTEYSNLKKENCDSVHEKRKNSLLRLANQLDDLIDDLQVSEE